MLIWLVFLELLACVMNLCQQRSILMLTQERNFRAIIIASRLVSLKLLLDSCPTDTIPQAMIDYRRKQLLLFLIGRQFIWFENLLPQSKLAICCLDCRGMVRMARHFPESICSHQSVGLLSPRWFIVIALIFKSWQFFHAFYSLFWPKLTHTGLCFVFGVNQNENNYRNAITMGLLKIDPNWKANAIALVLRLLKYKNRFVDRLWARRLIKVFEGFFCGF